MSSAAVSLRNCLLQQGVTDFCALFLQHRAASWLFYFVSFQCLRGFKHSFPYVFKTLKDLNKNERLINAQAVQVDLPPATSLARATSTTKTTVHTNKNEMLSTGMHRSGVPVSNTDMHRSCEPVNAAHALAKENTTVATSIGTTTTEASTFVDTATTGTSTSMNIDASTLAETGTTGIDSGSDASTHVIKPGLS